MSSTPTESAVTFIDVALIDSVAAAAGSSARRRTNRNFHHDSEHPSHRLLNAIEPGSYVVPHRHLDPNKDETFVVLRGRLGLVIFDDAGGVVAARILGPQDATLGVDLPHGTWHSALALASGTVFLEAKAGPYRALTEAERAPWAPAEGAPEAGAYYASLLQLFSGTR
jgi:cupin fold WbuC family metalloprotein